MFKVSLWLGAALMVLCSATFGHESEVEAYNYIDQYGKLAVEEMRRSRIPASIKLAQALVETNCGRSNLSQQSNNHFGLKCKSYWNGPSHYQNDDDYDKQGRKIKSCFRSYKTTEDSYRDHSDFLRLSPNYRALFQLSITDYKGWAYGLKESGYATDKKYAQKLIQVIERYQLYQFDQNQSHGSQVARKKTKTNETKPPEPFLIPKGYKMGDFKH